eukprot:7033875-Alexandrium_andersonii.AAC.1
MSGTCSDSSPGARVGSDSFSEDRIRLVPRRGFAPIANLMTSGVPCWGALPCAVYGIALN